MCFLILFPLVTIILHRVPVMFTSLTCPSCYLITTSYYFVWTNYRWKQKNKHFWDVFIILFDASGCRTFELMTRVFGQENVSLTFIVLKLLKKPTRRPENIRPSKQTTIRSFTRLLPGEIRSCGGFISRRWRVKPGSSAVAWSAGTAGK